MCIGGLHGNEPAGVVALQRFFASVEVGSELRGRVIGLAGNLRALAAGQRFANRDFNRMWMRDLVEEVRRRGADGLRDEEAEMLELLVPLEEALEEADGGVFVLDLHTFSGEGSPFVTLDDTVTSRILAESFPFTLVMGLDEKLAGTLSSWLSERGANVLGFEAGRHQDPASVESAEAAIWLALEACSLLPCGVEPRVMAARRTMSTASGTAAHLVDVRYRHSVSLEDEFRMEPGWVSFQPVARGELVGRSKAGEVHAPMSGLLLMPLYQAQGEEGFFVVTKVSSRWLAVSELARRLGVARVLCLLSGVDAAAGEGGRLRVDLRIASALTLRLCRILGYRQQGEAPVVVMTPRAPRRPRPRHEPVPR